ncbi:serine O-acetyltransferase [Curtobacterium ammoniigenes]|uniref:serine O-acetyltransferase n=1 Tax=Curtobacterium ammoniigenes TaxID=395387 RepID=UPI003570E2D7
MFRFANRARVRMPRPISMIVGIAYRLCSRLLLGCEIPASTQIGSGLQIHHGFGIVVNSRSKIGSNVELRQCTTIGSRYSNTDCPTIEDGVSVGANVVIIGAIRVGAGSQIGAGAVVLSDIPPGSTAAGNPARALQ